MKIIVVGGGISGCFAAIKLKRAGVDVTILEKKDRVLKKMLVTGNGRCNLTNMSLSSGNYNSDFVSNSINRFDNEEFKSFLETMGILTTVENVDRVYPVTLKAQSVVNAMLYEMEDLGVEIFTSSNVLSIKKSKNGFILNTNEKEYVCDKIIFATGGESYPKLGSDGKSYSLLKNFGHNVVKTVPALTQVILESDYLKHLTGVKVVGNVNLFLNGEEIASDFGELLFTDYGISGPPILNISKIINKNSGDMFIELPIINNVLNKKDLIDTLYTRFYMLNYFSFERWLVGLVDKKFNHYISKSVNIELDRVMSSVDEREFSKLIELLFKSRFKVVGTKGFENSQVTSGGFDTLDVDSNSMESKLIKGLYIVGEALDIDGDCGGYNIQWAYSSAMSAVDDVIERRG